MTDENMQMDGDEFLRANFFSSEAEMDAAKAEKLEPTPPKHRTKADADVRALARFTKALDATHQDARRAAIFWLADRYLGMKPRDWR